MIGTCFWRIVCFAIHLQFSSRSAEDGLYHQRQALLRNTANGITGLGKLLQISWTWRKHARRVCYRVLPLLLSTILSVTAFGVAGVFSSQVSSASGNDVLVTGGNCCIVLSDLVLRNISLGYELFNPLLTQRMTSASSYAQQCYRGNSTPEECPLFTKTNLPYTVQTDRGCPFGHLCLDDTETIYIDSGYINSHDDLGMNSPPHERFLYRAVEHCALLNSTKYSIRDETAQAVSYYYGPRGKSRNETYMYTTQSQPIHKYWISAPDDYSIR